MTPARTYARSALLGAAVAVVVELALLVSGGPFFGYEPLGDVFDAQARSFLDGRWDIPADVIKIEGFEIDGRTYTYFGPVPALLRLPIVAFTDGFDGRLTRLSMLVAWALTLAVVGHLAWRARRALRGADESVDRFEQVLVGLLVFAVGAGSSVTYLTSRPSVFHEAIAWGVATTLVAIDGVVAWSARRTWPRHLVVLALATAALLTRASVGAAPALAVGFVLLGDVVRGVRDRELAMARRAILLGLTLLLPLVAYAAVNHARFGTAFTLPYDRHRVSMVVEHRRDVLAANGGTIQGPQFLPTTAFHFVRPDAIGVDGAFPWIDFPRPATVIGDVLMDQVDASSSVPSSMPALSLLACVGVLAAVRDRRLRLLRAPLGGTAACLVVTLAIGFVAQRYTADAVPLLAVAGATAVPVLGMLSRRRAAAVAGVATLALLSVAVTAALTLQFQRHYGFLTPPHLRGALAERQLALPHTDASVPVVRVAATLPRDVGPDRTFVVVGDCDGVYRSDGTSWQPVEGTPKVGHHRVRVRAGREPLPLVAGISVRREGDRVVVSRGDVATRPIPVGAGEAVVLDVTADPLAGFVDVRHRGELVLSDFYLDRSDSTVLVESDVVEALPTPTPVCEALVGRSS